MTGYQTERSSYDDEASSVNTPISSNGDHAMAGAYGKDGVHGYEQADHQLEPMDPNDAPNGSLADLKDPIQVHLLTETALSDSKEYEILSQEEVDKLKKQCQLLSQRVESTRSNLAIQSKYRDAAVSMAKLYSAGKTEEELLDDPRAKEVELERETTEKKCEELSRELFNLEKNLIGPQRRLLQHTAGILQLTHKASKRAAARALQNSNEVPGSPESLYTYSQSRDSLAQAVDEDYFEDPSLYQLDSMQGLQTGHLKSAIDIPLKSPVREQATHLRGEIDKAKEENALLVNLVADMEQKLESLSLSLRETIVKFNPEVNSDYLDPPRESAAGDSKPGDMLRKQLDYLESGLVAVQAEQESFISNGGGNSSGGNNYLLDDGAERIEAVLRQQNEERRRQRAEKGLVDDDDTSDDDAFDADEAYNLYAFESKVDWLFKRASTLKDQKSVLKRQIKQQRELNNKTDAEKDEEIERRQEELDQTRFLLERAEKDAMDAQTMLADALQDLEKAQGSSSGISEEELHKHTAKIGSLEAELAKLHAQIESHQAAIEERDAKLEALDSEVEENIARAESLEAETQAHKARVDSLEGEIQARNDRIEALEAEIHTHSTRAESLQAEVLAHGVRVESLESEIQARSVHIESLEDKIQGHNSNIGSLEAEIQSRDAQIRSLGADLQAHNERGGSYEAQIAALEAENKKFIELSSQLDGASKEKAAAEEMARALQQEVENIKASHTDKEKEIAQKDADLEQLNMTLVEIKTELTFARAELDGAYGSRAERAADAAALSNQEEVVKLTGQVERLKKELAGTVQDLEAITKETIGAEREKIDLEQKADEAISAKASLEADLEKSRQLIARLQEDLDSERFKVGVSQGGVTKVGAGAALLSEQFRTSMREERKRFHEDIKEERAKYRKLEEEYIRLKKSQAASNAPPSPR
ncbi:up-regulated during septation domain-containing protein [Trichoderma breve]|uniref:Up-regulated during septation domain-containing protein n=1 Tax=Trichoderma breve TaxID=2034170 RepID=A0A9W9E5N6_9HYPO|nr:up-regulated during septation domain-containing protein [Trichoderma breve]KAJ4859054.1 up-regulated during septation domain-containing protein [Trichoderma breve]